MVRILTITVLLIGWVASGVDAQTATPTPRPGLTGSAAKAVVKCEKALAQAANTFVTKKQASLKKCVDTVYACVQLKPTDVKCLPKARTACDKQFTKIGAAEDKLIGSITSKCTSGNLTDSDLFSELGMGFSLPDFTATCEQVGVTVVDLADVAECITKQHECAVEDLLAGQSPLAAYLLGLVGRESRSPFCPALPSPTPTLTPAATVTATVTPGVTAAETTTPTATATGETPTPTGETPTPTPSETPTATESATPAETPTSAATVTPVETATPGETATPVETATPGETVTPVETATPAETPTATPEETATATPEETPTATPEETVTPTPEDTATPTPEDTGTPTETPTPEDTPTP